jgi:hypothetical protein
MDRSAGRGRSRPAAGALAAPMERMWRMLDYHLILRNFIICKSLIYQDFAYAP